MVASMIGRVRPLPSAAMRARPIHSDGVGMASTASGMASTRASVGMASIIGASIIGASISAPSMRALSIGVSSVPCEQASDVTRIAATTEAVRVAAVCTPAAWRRQHEARSRFVTWFRGCRSRWIYDVRVQRAQGNVSVDGFGFTIGETMRRLDFPHAQIAGLRGDAGSLEYGAKEIAVEKLVGRLTGL